MRHPLSIVQVVGNSCSFARFTYISKDNSTVNKPRFVTSVHQAYIIERDTYSRMQTSKQRNRILCKAIFGTLQNCKASWYDLKQCGAIRNVTAQCGTNKLIAFSNIVCPVGWGRILNHNRGKERERGEGREMMMMMMMMMNGERERERERLGWMNDWVIDWLNFISHR